MEPENSNFIASIRHRTGRIAFLLLYVFLNACMLLPEGYELEQEHLRRQGQSYSLPYSEREWPEFPTRPTWNAVLERALLANGELEAAYYEWIQAMEEVGIASTYPNANLSVGYDYIFSGGNLKSFDRMMFSLGFDSTQHLSYPPKVRTAGRIALSQAQAAGERFRAKKFAVQTKVLTAWANYSLLAKQLSIARENLFLLQTLERTAEARARTTEGQAELLQNNVALSQARNRVRDLVAELERERAILNALLGREPGAELIPPEEIELRDIPPDLSVISAQLSQNPEVRALSREVEAGKDMLELAELQWYPDISPSVAFTGSVSQSVGAMMVLPTTIPAIRARIRQSQAAYSEVQARLRQAEQDRASEFVATLVALRNSERQARLFGEEIIPQTELLARAMRSGYANGSRLYLELITAEQALLEARLSASEARADAAKALAELEQLLGADIETMTTESAPLAEGRYDADD